MQRYTCMLLSWAKFLSNKNFQLYGIHFCLYMYTHQLHVYSYRYMRCPHSHTCTSNTHTHTHTFLLPSGVVVDPHRRQLHVTLSHQYLPEYHAKLEDLVRSKVDSQVPTKWELRLYILQRPPAGIIRGMGN